MTALVYSPHYDIGFLGLERLHPFDSRKYGRAWRVLRQHLGPRLKDHHVPVDRPAGDAELLLAHTPGYLASLGRSRELADALELPFLRYVPNWLLHWCVLTPMRWAVRGTLLAVRAALQRGSAINLSGGYHHAGPGRGEGFCLYSDFAIAVRAARAEGLLPPTGRIAHVDLDAHMGNGVAHQFRDDPSVFLFDVYNPAIYPQDREAGQRLDCPVHATTGTNGSDYLALLRRYLPGFLDSVGESSPICLGFYNAGTDIVDSDPLGLLSVSPADVVARDRLVIAEFRRRGIPVVMVPSGGYTRDSYQLLAAGIEAILSDHPPIGFGGVP
jgi:histone deacetylase 11